MTDRYAEADAELRAADNNLAASGADGTFRKNAIKARIALYGAWGRNDETRAQEALLAAAEPANPPK